MKKGREGTMNTHVQSKAGANVPWGISKRFPLHFPAGARQLLKPHLTVEETEAQEGAEVTHPSPPPLPCLELTLLPTANRLPCVLWILGTTLSLHHPHGHTPQLRGQR